MTPSGERGSKPLQARGVIHSRSTLLHQVFSEERNAALTCLGLRFCSETDHVAYALKVYGDERFAEGYGGLLILARLLHWDHFVCRPVHDQQRCRQPGQYVKRARRTGIDGRGASTTTACTTAPVDAAHKAACPPRDIP
jgi:hypothetical protein